MKPFLYERGFAAAMPAANIDTDVIMPKQFLKGIDREGLSHGLFHDLRFDEQGGLRTDFVLNRVGNIRFLFVGPNFGCGSSREHAVWGMLQFGIRAIIGTSFAGIFSDNAANNGLLLVTLPPAQLEPLVRPVSKAPVLLTIDLATRQINIEGLKPILFDIDPMRARSLMCGLDCIGETLQHAHEVRTFEHTYFAERPWLGPDTSS